MATPNEAAQPDPDTAGSGRLDPEDALEKAMDDLRSVAQSNDTITAEPASRNARTAAGDGLSSTLREVPLDVQAVIGRTSMSVAQLNALQKGATVPLDSRVGDPVDIVINGVKVATGQMQLSEDDPDRFAFKVISVCA